MLLRAKSSPQVKYHNIIGVYSNTSVISSGLGPSDGVVSAVSARVPDSASEKVVDADHVKIHMQPESILEVRRILIELLDEVDANDRVAGSLGNGQRTIEPASVPSESQGGKGVERAGLNESLEGASAEPEKLRSYKVPTAAGTVR